MNKILLVAKREFRQIAGTRSFWITLLVLPIVLALGPLAQKLVANEEPERVMVIDHAGLGSAQALAAGIRREQDRAILVSLSRYVERQHLERADPHAIWARHAGWFGEEAITRFEADGGLPEALASLKRIQPAGIPDFVPPRPGIAAEPAPPRIAALPEADLDDALAPLLHPAGKSAERVDDVILIPADFAASGTVRMWVADKPDRKVVTIVLDVLRKQREARFLETQDLPAGTVQSLRHLTPTIAISAPPPGAGSRETRLHRSILPIAASYLLALSLMLGGSWMLQATVEERSDKLLETVLACITPEELMYGKLLGMLAIGLSMMLVWIGCGIVSAFAAADLMSGIASAALAPFGSPAVVLATVYFIVAGYVALSVLFLMVGAVSGSMRDAQGYLTPIVLVLVLPIAVLMHGIISGGGSVAIEILTWIPIWTPFAILARLGAGVPVWEMVGAGTMLALFILVELRLLGHIFRANLLASEGQLGLKALLRPLAVRQSQ